jgi:aminoglycoside phosphotransferase (APT) family kinase protein
VTRPTQVEADPAGLRLDSLRTYLAGRGAGIDPDLPIRATLFAGGRSNLTYRLDQGESAWVLRRPPLGHVLPTAHDMARESRVLGGLARAGVPVPKPLLFCDDADVIGAPFLLMQYVAGTVIATEDDAARLTDAQAAAASEAAVDALVSLHQVDPAEAGLADLGRADGYLERQVRRWATQWDITRTRPVDGIDELVEWLTVRTGQLPAGLPTALIHGDYRLDNLILSPVTLRVRAILDFEMSTLGDPVADLALALVYWSQASDVRRRQVAVAAGVTDGPGFWNRAQVLEAYASRTGLGLDHLDICLALACFKLAVVLESIHARTLGGQQLGVAAGDGGGLADAAPLLVAMGLDVTRGGGLAALGT